MRVRASAQRVSVGGLALICVARGMVHADPAPRPDVTGAPIPGEESGRADAGEDGRPSTARVVARGALFLPRMIVSAVLWPIRGVVWVYDRYALLDVYDRVLFNDARTFGIVPTVVYQTGVGLLAGARLIATDTFGDEERLTLDAAYGGTYQVRTGAWLDSGRRLGRVVLTVGGNFERFGQLPFYGIGNADESPTPPMLVDSLVDDTAFETHYRYQALRAAAAADVRTVDALHVIARGAIADRTHARSAAGPSIDAVYDPADLVGFEEGVTQLVGELELRWASEPRFGTATYTTGWLASAFLGGSHLLDGGSDFVRYGFDLRASLHAALRPRTLALRLRGEGVTGQLDEVPFSELPYLGGDVLRGYELARFRDRVAVAGSAEYRWDLSRHVNAFLFVDAGRVYRSLADLTVDDLRVGFGGGFELHGDTDFVIAGTLASSIDGGIVVTAVLNPPGDEGPRWR